VRKHWNWTGVIESDCGGISGIQAHGNVPDQKGAAVAAVKATVGMECDSAYKAHLLQAESEGKVTKGQLVTEVVRTFKVSENVRKLLVQPLTSDLH
jgi:beta-glucosidase